jgi:uncharacterized protein
MVHNATVHSPANPFTFGALALDDAFTDRDVEIDELVSDMRNGQDVVVLAPRRYGKTSLVRRAASVAGRDGVLVAYCDLLRTPTKSRFAAALAKAIVDELETPVGGALERAAALVRSLRVRPTVELDPHDGGVRFSFDAVRRSTDVDATIERLLELPGEIAAERKRTVVLVLDEFQEVVRLDDALPNVMRAVFQTQPEVGHVYLGSRRHVLRSIFDDRHEPFWRSAKQIELGRIARDALGRFVHERFVATGRAIDDDALARLLELTDGHPYATQELAYFTWEVVLEGYSAHLADVDQALEAALRSEHNGLVRLWEGSTANERLVMLALNDEPGSVYAEAYRRRHGLPAPASLQRAVAALVRDDVVERSPDGGWRIAEPFLRVWLERGETELARGEPRR